MEYCEIKAVKDRLLIKHDDPSWDDALEDSVKEASRMVDLFMKPYTRIPLDLKDEEAEIVAIITADFAASVFKRRWMPEEAKIRGTLQPDMINDVDGTGWFALGYKKLQEYIKSFYALKQEILRIRVSDVVPYEGSFCAQLRYVLDDERVYGGIEQSFSSPIPIVDVSSIGFHVRGDGTTPINIVIALYFDDYPYPYEREEIDISGVTAWVSYVLDWLEIVKEEHPEAKLKKIRLFVFNGPSTRGTVNVYVDKVSVMTDVENVFNGGFEEGDFTGWVTGYLTEDDNLYLDVLREGNYCFIVSEREEKSINNPEAFMLLFKQGILTLKEARAYMANAEAVITERTAKITSLDRTETNVITTEDTKRIHHDVEDTKKIRQDVEDIKRIRQDTEDVKRTRYTTEDIKNAYHIVEDTKRIYHTSKQKSFVFIESDPNSNGYRKQVDVAG